MSLAKLLDRQSDGCTAALALEVVEPVLAARQRGVLEGAMGRYRCGQLHADEALAKIAEMTALDDLRQAMRDATKKGHRATAQLATTPAPE